MAERTDPAAVIRAIAAAVAPARIEVRRPTLEDVFISIVEAGATADRNEHTHLRASLHDNSRAPEVR
jgi:hypothetical protein